MLSWIVLLLLGIVVGMLSGLLGIGGGIILVPILAIIFPYININPDVAVHLAIGTSLATASLTLFSSSLAHRRNGNLLNGVFYQFLPGIIVGAISGAFLAHMLSAVILRHIIGFLLCGLALNMAFDYEIPSTRKLPNQYYIILSGFVISLVSSFAGLSGAVFIVPYLIWFGTNMRYSVGTAAMCGLPLSFVAMCSHMLVGYNVENLPHYAVGYVYLPAAIVIAITSVPTAQFAAKLSLQLPKELLKRLLAMVLTFVAAKMLFF